MKNMNGMKKDCVFFAAETNCMAGREGVSRTAF